MNYEDKLVYRHMEDNFFKRKAFFVGKTLAIWVPARDKMSIRQFAEDKVQGVQQPGEPGNVRELESELKKSGKSQGKVKESQEMSRIQK